MTMQDRFKDSLADLREYLMDGTSIIETWRERKKIAEALRLKLIADFDSGDEVAMQRTINDIEQMFLENEGP